MFNKHKHKIWIPIIIITIVFQLAGVALFAPRPVYAQGLPTYDFMNFLTQWQIYWQQLVAKQAEEVKDTVWDRIYKALVLSAAITIKNVYTFMAQKAGEKLLEQMMTGGRGQTPSFETQTREYFEEQVVEYSLGEVLDVLSTTDKWNEKFDICNPNLDLKLKVLTTLNLQGQFVQRNPRCRWSSVKANWEGFVDEMKNKYWDNAEASSFLVIENFSDSFTPQQSGIGNYILAMQYAQGKYLFELGKKEAARDEGGGSKDTTDVTNQTQKVPIGTSQEIYNQVFIKDNLGKTKDEVEMATQVMETIPESMAGAFLSTFVSQKFVNFLFDKVKAGFVDKAASYSYEHKTLDYTSETQKTISQLDKIGFSVSVKEVNLLTDFMSCPDSTNRSINNCVIDSSFAKAVQEADYGTPLTVAEAIEKGDIKGNSLLISDINSENKSPNCWEKGLCYSNLVKLRKARIIPIGWELAAQAVKNEPVTLQEAIDQFDVFGSPYYHLIDKNWILKYPKTLCNAVGYGPLLVGSGARERNEYCADMTSCIKTGSDGVCKAYAYCAAEKNTWRLGGTECEGQYDSCRSFASPEGQTVNYIYNTLDKSGCNGDNAGCKWYSANLESTAGAVSTWSSVDVDKAYFNNNLTSLECSPDAEGCTGLIRRDKTVGANLLANGDFDYYTGTADDSTADKIQGWLSGWSAYSSKPWPSVTFETDSDVYTAGNGNYIRVNNTTDDLFTSVLIEPKNFSRFFYVSADVRIPATTYYGGWGVSTYKNDVNVIGSSEIYRSHESNSQIFNDIWTKTSKIVKINPNINRVGIVFQGVGGIDIDNVMITEIPGPATTEAGWLLPAYNAYATTGLQSLKKAPDYYNCYNYENSSGVLSVGSPQTTSQIYYEDDKSQCSDFARLCAAEDVGCQTYRPSDGGLEVTAVASYEDQCPSQCAGYDAYSQSKTNFSAALFPLYFIPSTAKTCSATEVGCEEFTNLDALGAGGEGREYFSYLRQCTKPDAENAPAADKKCANFYTWVGSEVSGYQLQVYSLVNNDKNNVDTTDDEPGISSVDIASDALCNAQTFDPEKYPDCREFYNEDGQVSYHKYSLTISCTEDCHPYRKTIKYVNSSECTNAHGTFDGGECVIMGMPSESRSCSASNAGCREYRGNKASDSQILLDDTFGASGSPASYDDWTGGSLSPESQVPGGHSLKLDDLLFETETKVYGVSNSAVGQFQVSAWLNSVDGGAMTIEFRSNSTTVATTQINIINGPNFLYYTSEPLFVTADFDSVRITAPIKTGATSGNATVYIDSIQLRTLNDIKYLITDSWTTPSVCNQTTLENASLPQAQIGCRQYSDTNGQTVFLKSFRNFCTAVGCEAYTDTKNTASPYEKNFSNGYKVKPDNLIYLVNDKTKECNSADRGCTMLGLPELDKSQTGGAGTSGSTPTDFVVKQDDKGNEIWNNQFYKLLPDSFEQSPTVMCATADLGCETYTDESGSPYYFRDPGARLCEWKKSSSVGQAESYDWFVKGTTQKCDTEDIYSDGTSHVIRPSDPGYAGWVGACVKKDDKCTAFIDPVDVSGTAQFGRPYYFINDDTINHECGNQVSKEEGCLLFRDTSMEDANGNPKVNFSAIKTYNKSEDNHDGGLVSALEGVSFEDSGEFINWLLQTNVDCGQFTENDYCQYIKDCVAGEDNDFGCILPYLPGWSQAVSPLTTYSNYNSTDCTSEEMACYMFTKSGDYADSNTVIKVTRDRECSQWYDCKSGYWTLDPTQGRYVYVCQELGLCDSLRTDTGAGRCANFIPENVDSASSLLSANKVITADLYSKRDVGWNSYDYSGMTLSNHYPLQFYDAFDINSGDETQSKDVRLAHIYYSQTGCGDDEQVSKNITTVNGVDTTEYVCAEPYSNVNTSEDFEASPASECRAYPRVDSPYPPTVKSNEASAAVFENVDVCDNGDNDSFDCGCSYKKYTYGGGAITKYFPEDPRAPVTAESGYCQNDSSLKCDCVAHGIDTIYDDKGNILSQPITIKTATMCSSDACTPAQNPGGVPPTEYGMCMLQDSKKTQYRGWSGYCLEGDESLNKNGDDTEKPCLTFYPLDVMEGLQNLYNNYASAGFDPEAYGFTEGGPYYCMSTARAEMRNSFDTSVSGWLDCDGGEENGRILINKNAYDDMPKYTTKQVKEEDDVGEWGNYWKLSKGGSDEEADCKKETADPVEVWKCEVNRCDNGVDNGEKLPNPQTACPSGYKAEYLYEVTRESEYTSDWEDWYTFNFVCVPVNTQETSTYLLKEDQDVGKGAFIDNGTLAVDENDDPVIEEVEYQSCTSFYNVVDEDTGKNKAFTNKIYSGEVIPGAPTASAGCGKLVNAKKLFGALFLFVSPVNIGLKPYNLFTSSSKCEALVAEKYLVGGEKWTDGVSSLQKLFASAYERFDSNYNSIRLNKGLCTLPEPWMYYNDDVNLECSIEDDCLHNEVYVNCEKKNLRHCVDEAGKNTGAYCYQDNHCNYMEGESCDGTVVTFNADISPEPNCSSYKNADGENLKGSFDDKAENEEGNLVGVCVGIYPPINFSFECSNEGERKFSVSGSVDSHCDMSAVPSSYAGGTSSVLGYTNPAVQYIGTTTPNNIYDKSFDLVNHPPIVAATVPSGRFDATKGNVIYAAKPGSITINAITDADVYVNANDPVSMTFYAWADDDQMPLTSVIVDWDDNTNKAPVTGKYKNHKPVCQSKGKEGEPLGTCNLGGNYITGLSCRTDEDCKALGSTSVVTCDTPNENRFGDTSGACDQSYFSYTHSYSCGGVGSPGWQDADNGCVFYPKVQVLDNWGWCNAEDGSKCTLPTSSSNVFSLLGNSLFTSGLDGCSEEKIPNQCDYFYNTDYLNATEFNGRVIVRP